MSVDHFCRSRKLSSALREKVGGGGAHSLCRFELQRPFTIINMKKVIGCSRRFYSCTSHSTRPLDARSQSSSLSSASSWSAPLPTGALFELLFRQHRIQCNSVQRSTSEHAFISMETRKEEENNNTMAEKKPKNRSSYLQRLANTNLATFGMEFIL